MLFRSYYGEEDGFSIYENQNYIPYGFTYDYYITDLQCDAYEEDQRAKIMLRAMRLTEEQAEKHADILRPLSADYMVTNGEADASSSDRGSSVGKEYLDLSSEAFAADCAARAETAAKSFAADSRGFTAEVELDRENLVFFSVPYEEGGWTATVDGQPVEIEKVNVGFMAVRVPEGAHTVRFEYMTPGLPIGCIITLGALVVLGAYLAIVLLRRRRHPDRWWVEYPEGDRLARRFAADQAEEEAYLAALEAEEWEEEPPAGGFPPDTAAGPPPAGPPSGNPPQPLWPPPEEDACGTAPPPTDAAGQPAGTEDRNGDKNAPFTPGFRVDLSAADEEKDDEQPR